MTAKNSKSDGFLNFVYQPYLSSYFWTECIYDADIYEAWNDAIKDEI